MGDLTPLPGRDLIDAGLEDLARGMHSVPALVVAIGAPRLRQLGVPVPPGPAHPEHRLYALLARDDANSAHSRYNALIRRLVSSGLALVALDVAFVEPYALLPALGVSALKRSADASAGGHASSTSPRVRSR